MNFERKFLRKVTYIIGVLKTHRNNESKKNICCNNDTNSTIIRNRAT